MRTEFSGPSKIGLRTLIFFIQLNVMMLNDAQQSIEGNHHGCRVSLRRASRNLPWVDVLPVAGANVYSMLQRDYLLLSRDALEGASHIFMLALRHLRWWGACRIALQEQRRACSCSPQPAGCC